MGITFGDHLIDSGYHDITPEQEREIEAREECARRGLDPDDDAADGATVWMVVDQELRERRSHAVPSTGSGGAIRESPSHRDDGDGWRQRQNQNPQQHAR
jgi:hypothetical protein